MTTLEVARSVKVGANRVPREFVAIAEDAAILVLIVLVASGADEIAKRLLGEHMPSAIRGLLTASLFVMCAIYAVAVLGTLRKLIVARLSGWRVDAAAAPLARIFGRNPAAAELPAGADAITPLSVLVVDDDRLASSAVKCTLALDPRIGSISTAAHPDAAIAKISSGPEQEAPDVVLLDVNYAGYERNGLDYLGELHEAAPHAKLVVMSVCREYAKDAVARDADGFIWKNESAVDFAEAVVGAAHNSFVASKSVTRDLFDTA